jgi:hypothetical protein
MVLPFLGVAEAEAWIEATTGTRPAGGDARAASRAEGLAHEHAQSQDLVVQVQPQSVAVQSQEPSAHPQSHPQSQPDSVEMASAKPRSTHSWALIQVSSFIHAMSWDSVWPVRL